MNNVSGSRAARLQHGRARSRTDIDDHPLRDGRPVRRVSRRPPRADAVRLPGASADASPADATRLRTRSDQGLRPRCNCAYAATLRTRSGSTHMPCIKRSHRVVSSLVIPATVVARCARRGVLAARAPRRRPLPRPATAPRAGRLTPAPPWRSRSRWHRPASSSGRRQDAVHLRQGHHSARATAQSSQCADNWPALTLAGGAKLAIGAGLTESDFGTITWADGTTQVTFKDVPLYYFAGDQAAGDKNGDGVGGIWHLATKASRCRRGSAPSATAERIRQRARERTCQQPAGAAALLRRSLPGRAVPIDGSARLASGWRHRHVAVSAAGNLVGATGMVAVRRSTRTRPRSERLHRDCADQLAGADDRGGTAMTVGDGPRRSRTSRPSPVPTTARSRSRTTASRCTCSPATRPRATPTAPASVRLAPGQAASRPIAEHSAGAWCSGQMRSHLDNDHRSLALGAWQRAAEHLPLVAAPSGGQWVYSFRDGRPPTIALAVLGKVALDDLTGRSRAQDRARWLRARAGNGTTPRRALVGSVLAASRDSARALHATRRRSSRVVGSPIDRPGTAQPGRGAA